MIGEPYMIKIAFFDIDGTLLKMGCKEPTDKTVKALNSLHQNGILLCMATGRGYLSIPKFKDITFDVQWFICNGWRKDYFQKSPE